MNNFHVYHWLQSMHAQPPSDPPSSISLDQVHTSLVYPLSPRDDVNVNISLLVSTIVMTLMISFRLANHGKIIVGDGIKNSKLFLK